MVEKFSKMMSTKCKTKNKKKLLSLSEKRLRHQAERRAAEAEKCLRQALQKTKLQRLLDLFCCKKRAKGDVAQSETAALTSDDWLVDTCWQMEARSMRLQEGCSQLLCLSIRSRYSRYPMP